MFSPCCSTRPGPAAWSVLPARGPGLNLGYAKNEARHRSLVSCPVKTISSSYSFSFMTLLLSKLLLPNISPSPVFVFPLRVRQIPFSHALRAASWKMKSFLWHRKASAIPTVMFVGWHSGRQRAAEPPQSELVNSSVTLPWNSEASGPILVRLLHRYCNEPLFSCTATRHINDTNDRRVVQIKHSCFLQTDGPRAGERFSWLTAADSFWKMGQK